MEIGFGDDGFGSHSCSAKKKKEITKARADGRARAGVKNLDLFALAAGLEGFPSAGVYANFIIQYSNFFNRL